MGILVENLSKRFGDQYAVDSISFSAKPGSILGFLGPNGAGKSTTMRMLTGYLKPDSGTAKIGGYDVGAEPMEVKKIMGYLPENTPLYNEMYIQEFLQFVAEISKVNQIPKRIKEVIDQIGLGSEQHKKIKELSKGYKQRVGLAQAIIHNPKVLILDEPTSGLDPNQLTDIRKLILELSKDKTVVLSTHIMQEVEALCNEIVILSHGKIVASNTLSGLKQTLEEQNMEVIFRKLTAQTH